MTATWSTTLWLDDVETEDHDEIGLARLIWQYRVDAPRIQGFLSAFLTQVQNFDDVTFQVLTGIWPLTAVGTQLDTLGDIIGQERGTLTDDQYRVVILARILANKAKGKTDELINIIEVAGATGTIQIRESWPAGICISAAGLDNGDILGPIIRDATPGGVYLHWAWSSHDDDDCFAMGDTLGADESGQTTGGFGDLTGATQTTGGYFTSGEMI